MYFMFTVHCSIVFNRRAYAFSRLVIMAVQEMSFTGVEPYRLKGVQITGELFHHSSHAQVLELEYLGLKCAGKKINEELFDQGVNSLTIHRFEEECRQLSQLRHPNTAQFLGVYFQEGAQTPILVWEFLPTNLTSCIQQYGILPKEITYSILHDVALGLCYLHSQSPPIIHCNLSSNNVLLTLNMTAKISDLGTARILDLTPLQLSSMMQTPCIPAYMAPEVMVADPKYDTSIDQFSYGILMIHIFSGKLPDSHEKTTDVECDELISVSEAEQQQQQNFIDAIGHDHPLVDLILKCISENPQCRAHASEIVEQLAKMVSQFHATSANRVELLRRTEADEEEKRWLQDEDKRKTTELQSKEEEISNLIVRKNALEENLQAQLQQKVKEIDDLKLAHSLELQQLRIEMKEMAEHQQVLLNEKESATKKLATENLLLKQKLTRQEKSNHTNEQSFEYNIKMERERYLGQVKITVKEYKEKLEEEKRKHEDKLQQMHERHEEYRSEALINKTTLESQNHELKANIEHIQDVVKAKDDSLSRIVSEIEVKTRALLQNDASILALNKELTKAREYFAAKKQPLQANITWKQCTNLPTKMDSGQSTIINGKVYYGGGLASAESDCFIYCYDPRRDEWTTLPQLVVRRFGLGHIDGKLAVVGGMRKDSSTANELYTINMDERSPKWKRNYPPMPTARSFPTVVSHQSILIVAGGLVKCKYTSVVEIYSLQTQQWYVGDRLPTPCYNMSTVVIQDVCYQLGGFNNDGTLNQVLCASINDLCQNAYQRADSVGTCDTQSAWRVLTNTPAYGPSAVVIAGSLFAIGGDETCAQTVTKETIYVHSPTSNSWIYISDLPAPRIEATATALSPTQILVIGGRGNKNIGKVNTVYKGVVQIVT